MGFGHGPPPTPPHRVCECVHMTVSFIFSLLYLYPCLVFFFHDISLFIPFLHSLPPLLHVSFSFIITILVPSPPYHFACVSYSFNYVWLFWTCFIFLFSSNFIFLSLAFLWAHLVSNFTQHWPNLSFCPSSASPPNPHSHPENSYLHAYTWFHFCGSFSPGCAAHILANREGGEAARAGRSHPCH